VPIPDVCSHQESLTPTRPHSRGSRSHQESLTPTRPHSRGSRSHQVTHTDPTTLPLCRYKAWCCSPVSALAVCFLAEQYETACALLSRLADLEVTVQTSREIELLVEGVWSLCLHTLPAHTRSHVFRELVVDGVQSLLTHTLTCFRGPQVQVFTAHIFLRCFIET
jgi:hypothetical protein